MMWLKMDKKHAESFHSLRRLYDVQVWNDMEEPYQKPKAKQRFLVPKWIYAAASVILFFLYLTQFNSSENQINYQSITVPYGQYVELMLPDSSKVWLNSHSHLTYATDFGQKNRKVSLSGEGYFKVKHGSVPFIVSTKNNDIEVLGTEFNVKSYEDQDFFQSSLIRGSIMLHSPLYSSQKLRPQMSATVEGNQLRIEKIGNYSDFLWRKGLISFSNNSLDEAFKVIERYYNITIDFHKPHNSTYAKTITGKFRMRDGATHILQVLQLTYHFTFTWKNKNTITIKN